jgi:hypothetical protein
MGIASRWRFERGSVDDSLQDAIKSTSNVLGDFYGQLHLHRFLLEFSAYGQQLQFAYMQRNHRGNSASHYAWMSLKSSLIKLNRLARWRAAERLIMISISFDVFSLLQFE